MPASMHAVRGMTAVADLLGRANLLAVSMLGFGAPMVLPALATNVFVIGVAGIIGGAIGIGWNVVTVSLRQRIVPDRLLGRVNAGYRLLAWGTMPVSAALGGLVGETFGLRAVFLVFGGPSLLLLPGRLVVTDGAIDAAEREAAAITATPAPGAATLTTA